MTTVIDKVVERWTSPSARPLFKGRLIDDDGCCCAQGDILRTYCDWTDARLRAAEQDQADKEVAAALGISVTHSILLRAINDRQDGCPQDVLAHPERVIGDQAPLVLAFWHHLDGMATATWEAAQAAAEEAVWKAADQAAGEAAWEAAREAAGEAAEEAAWRAAWEAAEEVAWKAARAAGGSVAGAVAGAAAGAAVWRASGAAAGAAARATNEIQGANRLSKFYFLPMFGITNPSELTSL